MHTGEISPSPPKNSCIAMFIVLLNRPNLTPIHMFTFLIQLVPKKLLKSIPELGQMAKELIEEH